MITLIEAKNYKSLRYISRRLDSFHVLVGANATGKSTFLDIIQFLSDIINHGIDKAIQDRVSYFEELTFGNKGGDIEFAIEVDIPEVMSELFTERKFSTIRYEIKIGKQEDSNENAIKEERCCLLTSHAKYTHESPILKLFFPEFLEIPSTILIDRYKPKQFKRVLSKSREAMTTFT